MSDEVDAIVERLNQCLKNADRRDQCIEKHFHRFAGTYNNDRDELVTAGLLQCNAEQVVQVVQAGAEELNIPIHIFDEFEKQRDMFDVDQGGLYTLREILRMFRMYLRQKRAQLSGHKGIEVPTLTVEKAGYKINGEFGRGKQGIVYHSTKQNRTYAMKSHSKLKIDDGGLHELMEEYALMQSFDNPHLCKAFEIFQDSSSVFLVSEAYLGGDFTTLARRANGQGVRMGEAWWRPIFRQCLDGLSYLHSKCVMHCDIKESNIMIAKSDSYDAPVPVFVDFGLAKPLVTTVDQVIAGTPGYIPPETWVNGVWYPRGDVFSLGIVFFQLVSGRVPTKHRTIEGALSPFLDNNWAAAARYKQLPWENFPKEMPDLKELIKCMTHRDRPCRPHSMPTLRHRWFSSGSDAELPPASLQRLLGRSAAIAPSTGSSGIPMSTPERDRGCTDLPCCAVFAVAFLIFAYITWYAFAAGHARWFGNFCEGTTDHSTSRPMLYFCPGGPAPDGGGYEVQSVCVDECPGTDDAGTLPQDCPHQATNTVAGFCVPADSDRAWELLDANKVRRALTHNLHIWVHECLEWWSFSLIPVATPIVFGVCFLLCLKGIMSCSEAIGTTPWVALISALPLLAGACLIGGSLSASLAGPEAVYFALGVISAVSALVFVCVAKARGELVQRALKCIEVACDCMLDCPALMLEPLVVTAAGCAGAVLALPGFLRLLSLLSPIGAEGEQVVARSFRHTPAVEWGFLVYYVLFCLWLLEVILAISDFAVSHVAHQWFFNEYDETRLRTGQSGECVMCAGVSVCVRHHLGTLMLGSCIVPIFRVVGMVMAPIQGAAQTPGNPVGSCLGRACYVCLACFRNIVQPLSRAAYMDVAIYSNDFFKATRHVQSILKDSAAVWELSGATLVIQFVGVGTAMVLQVAISYTALKFWFGTSMGDTVGPHIIAVALGFSLIRPFMLIFGQVFDTILLCFAISEGERPERLWNELDGDPSARKLNLLPIGPSEIFPDEEDEARDGRNERLGFVMPHREHAMSVLRNIVTMANQ